MSKDYMKYYRTKEWKALRLKVLERDEFTCLRCQEDFSERTGDLNAHHVIRRKIGGGDHPSNLKTLCYWCHRKEHQHKFDIPIEFIGVVKR